MTESDHIDLFNERAAIREFDGGLSRAEAESKAYLDWRSIVGRGIVTPQVIVDCVAKAKSAMKKK